MRVLHVTNAFLPCSGGSTIRLYNLLTRLSCEVLLYTLDRIIYGWRFPEEEKFPPNIDIKRLSLCSYRRLIGRVPYLGYLFRLSQIPGTILNHLEADTCDVIHVHSGSGLVLRKVARKVAKPLVYEVHAVSYVDFMRDLPWGPIFYPYINRSNKEICKRSDRVVTLTESLKEWINRFYKVPLEKITIVPNGVDMNIFTPGEGHSIKANELRESLGIGGKVVMYAGFMDSINGIPALAQIIPRIIRDRANICFLLIGSGPEERRLKSLAQEYPHNVKFLARVPYSEMPAYYRMCDIFVVPRPSTISAETVTPLKLLEAMAMEKPVLGSNVGGITEAITHGENGYLFQKGNIESFQRILLEALDADNTGIGREARKTVVERYDWDRSAGILQQVYEEVLWK